MQQFLRGELERIVARPSPEHPAPGGAPSQGSCRDQRLDLVDPSSPRRRSEVRAVVDASVFVAALVDSDRDGLWAERLISEGPIAAPELALVEATNVLRRLERAGRISRLEATAASRDVLRLDIEIYPFGPFADRVWDLRAKPDQL